MDISSTSNNEKCQNKSYISKGKVLVKRMRKEEEVHEVLGPSMGHQTLCYKLKCDLHQDRN